MHLICTRRQPKYFLHIHPIKSRYVDICRDILELAYKNVWCDLIECMCKKL